MSTATDQTTSTLVERLSLKTIVESCLVLEDGLAALKDIELGMMAGAGILPGPFARADEQGLDEVLAALERAEAEWGENYRPPKIIRRLVAQGRLGKKSGQGFFPYPQPDGGQSREVVGPTTTVRVGHRRGETAMHEMKLGPAVPGPQVDLHRRRPGWDADVGAVPAVGEHDPPARDELHECARHRVPVGVGPGDRPARPGLGLRDRGPGLRHNPPDAAGNNRASA